MKSELQLKNIHILAEGKEIVSGADLNIKEGEAHVLMGKNGSGKSTIVNALMGHPKYEVTAGEMLFDGEDILTLATEKKAQKGIFLSMQYLPEIDGVTLTNFLFKAYSNLDREKMSVIDFYKHLKEVSAEIGIDTKFLARDVNVGLSGGEKKLSEVLQMAILTPKFAFLDEIDSGVDVDSVKKIYDAIVRINKKNGTGILLITHNPEVLSHISPDFVHVMREGKIVADGGVELVEKIKEEGFSKIGID